MERLFVALSLPDTVRDIVAQLAEPLPGVNWTRPEQLHVTLRFLGGVEDERIPALIERLEPVHVEPFILPLEGVGTFPPKRPPRVLWLGVGKGHPRLFQLRQRLDDALLSTGLQLDVRTFHPHITLARCAENAAAAVAGWSQRHRDASAPPFRVEAFDLFSSELRPSGAVHTLKRRFALAK